ncbi:hypothetical protein BDN71DRAFT_1431455 [Pleurotus eryngii]|uniref:Uncharacterized protein n=1 Tax=Pleurotus eryngii TaxID=5323 RepID=A0A9P5ZVU4_PLEER|nr:hypothetical protein BDN71DRAFT_1431455 [Pleurotus eryngii]
MVSEILEFGPSQSVTKVGNWQSKMNMSKGSDGVVEAVAIWRIGAGDNGVVMVIDGITRGSVGPAMQSGPELLMLTWKAKVGVQLVTDSQETVLGTELGSTMSQRHAWAQSEVPSGFMGDCGDTLVLGLECGCLMSALPLPVLDPLGLFLTKEMLSFPMTVAQCSIWESLFNYDNGTIPKLDMLLKLVPAWWGTSIVEIFNVMFKDR